MRNEPLEEKIQQWKPQRLAVLGLGVSNRPLVRLLLEKGCRVLGCDRTPREALEQEVLALEERGLELRVGPDYLEDLEADVVFRTPGLHPDDPALARLRQRGAVITSEMEVFFACCPCPILAVTGSDGKTTTTTLIAHMLKAAGKTVWLGGNIGAPLLPQVEQMLPEHVAVVELSSFQLMYMNCRPKVAVVTNLAPNHLDVHKNMEEYVRAKAQIFLGQRPQDRLVLNLDNQLTRNFATHAMSQVTWFSRAHRPDTGVFLEDGGIYRIKDGSMEKLMEQADILLPGIHNVENYMAAIAAVEDLVPVEAIVQVARTFRGVEHRIELVREKDGVRFYNDSIASSPSRTIAGLRSFAQPVILIAGGYDKHIPYDILGPEICAHVKTLVLNGATAEKIRQAVVAAPQYRPGHPEIVEQEDFTQAVHTAAELAQPGDVVLLSPASAAFDQFKNFMVRGKFFKKLVMEL